jgi:hypothetical protein
VTPTEPAAPASRRSLVRRRESFVAAAWRVHGGDAIVATACLLIAFAMAVFIFVSGWLAVELSGATESGDVASAAIIGGMAGVVILIVGPGFARGGARWLRTINASRRYLDNEGDGPRD